MKTSVWKTIIKTIIAVATAILSVISARPDKNED